MAASSESSAWLKGLPNKLSLLRMVAVPVLLWFDSLGSSYNLASGLVFAVAAVTDLVDGFVARRYGGVSPLGALLDQVADKMLVAAALIVLARSGTVAPAVAAVLICRDIAVNGIRLMALEQKVVIAVSDFGKWKTVLLSFGITCLLVDHPVLGLPVVEAGQIGLALGTALSLYSGWAYSRAFLSQVQVLGKSPV